MTLKEARKAKKMTQSELAALSGISTRHLIRVENGQFPIKKMAAENLIRMANALEVDLKELMEV